jgi:hypothetical protein
MRHSSAGGKGCEGRSEPQGCAEPPSSDSCPAFRPRSAAFSHSRAIRARLSGRMVVDHPSRSLCREWRRSSPEPIDPAENLGKQRPRHRDLGQLEHHVAAVAPDAGPRRTWTMLDATRLAAASIARSYAIAHVRRRRPDREGAWREAIGVTGSRPDTPPSE